MKKNNTVTVALIGMTGCGKTTVGKIAAGQLGCRFADLDEEIVRGEGRPVRELFEREGEAAFRRLETEYLRRLTDRTADTGDLIIACGGGAPLRPETRALLSGAVRTVWIRRRPESVFRSPAILMRPPLYGSRRKYRALLAEREPIYRETARYVLESGEPSETAQALCRLVRNWKEEEE